MGATRPRRLLLLLLLCLFFLFCFILQTIPKVDHVCDVAHTKVYHISTLVGVVARRQAVLAHKSNRMLGR